MKLFSVRENFSKSFDFEGDRFNEIINFKRKKPMAHVSIPQKPQYSIPEK